MPDTAKTLFSTNSNPDITRKLIAKGNYRRGEFKISRFADGEISVLIDEDIEEKDVYVLGSSFPPAKNLLELLILIHTLKENGASKIHALIPYWGYAKADHIKPKGATLSAKLMAETLQLAGIDSVSVVNIHSQTAQDFFNVPFTYLDAVPLFAKKFNNLNKSKTTIVAPDKGGVKRAERFAKLVGVRKVAYVNKIRPEFDEAEIASINGEIDCQTCIIVDDMAQSGGTLLENARVLKENGAKDVFIAVTHIVHTGGSVPKLDKEDAIDKVYFTNTIPYPKPLSGKFEIVDVSELFYNL